MAQEGGLELLVDRDQILADIRRGDVLRCDHDLDGVRHCGLGEHAHLGRERGREQQVLALSGQLLDDLVDVGDEAHVEHAVRFVDDEGACLVEMDRAAGQHVQQAAGRRHQNVHALDQALLLGFDLHAAIHRHGADFQIPGVVLDVVFDLNRQLPRRRQDDGMYALGTHLGRLLQGLQDGQHEACRLAGTRLGGGDQVVTGQHDGDRLLLDGSRGLVALLGDGLDDGIAQTKGRKWHGVSTCLEGEGQAHILRQGMSGAVMLTVAESPLTARRIIGHRCSGRVAKWRRWALRGNNEKAPPT